MKIESSAFKDGETIPTKYSCDGENINPPLVFVDVPKTARSLVLIMDDIDAPRSVRPNGLWNHWLVWNMPPATKGIGEGAVPPGIQGRTTSGKAEYYGPCPPDKEHRYFFKLYALDTTLNINQEEIGRDGLLETIKGHVLIQAELMGKFNRQK